MFSGFWRQGKSEVEVSVGRAASEVLLCCGYAISGAAWLGMHSLFQPLVCTWCSCECVSLPHFPFL